MPYIKISENFKDEIRDADGNVTQEGTVLTSEHFSHIEDGILSLETAINNLGGTTENVIEYGIFTQQSSNVTLHAGHVAGTKGALSESTTYDSFSFVATEECRVYVSDVEKYNHNYFSLSVIPEGATSGTRYRYMSTEDTLPTAENPLTVISGSTIIITIPVHDVYWSVYSTIAPYTISSELNQAIKNNHLIVQNTVISDEMQNILILKKCGIRDDMFLAQNFLKLVDTSTNANTWRLGTTAVFKRIGNEFCYYKGDIVIAGEWECAIQESGADDFVGGNAHGDEQLVSAYMSLDGKTLNLSDNFLTSGRCLDIVRNTIFNRCNTPDDNVMKHFVRYVITTESIFLHQTVEWLQDMDLISSYLLMFPVSREYTKWAYIDTTNEIVDISEAGHSKPTIDGNKAHYLMWSDNFSARVEFECEGAFEGANSYISPSTNPPYNKIYHNFVGTNTQTAVTGHKITMNTKIVCNYNE